MTTEPARPGSHSINSSTLRSLGFVVLAGLLILVLLPALLAAAAL